MTGTEVSGDAPGGRGHSFLTTREVADLLRVKERKIYELVAEGSIPVSRATGKLLFPQDLVEAWVQRHVSHRGAEAQAEPPTVLAGSHDPLLDWALRESGSGIAAFYDGSLDGLTRLAARGAIAAGLHLAEPEDGTWNVRHVAGRLAGEPVVLLEWARRRQGLVVPSGNPRRLAGIADLAGTTVAVRQEGAGSRVLFDQLLAGGGIAPETLSLLVPPCRSEADVAAAVAEGKADAGLAVEGAARLARLDFVPLVDERFDLLVWRRHVFEPPMQRLLAFARTEAFARRARELGGYDLAGFGTVHLNGP